MTPTLNRLLETQLALRAYKCDHGAYPNSLSELAPAYLTRVPEDPFSNHAPLIYRRDGKRYTLYSIGFDAKDDGGKPISFSDLKGDEHCIFYYNTYSLIKNPIGDIVAGVNY